MKFATVYNIMSENKLVQWHIFVILIFSCISTLVAPSNLSIIVSIGMEVYNSPLKFQTDQDER